MNSEGRSLKFEKSPVGPEKKPAPTEVEIISEIKIGGGQFGEIFEAEAKIGTKNRNFVIKKFKDVPGIGDAPSRSAEEVAAVAFENYGYAKKSGLKVFPTYRLGEDKKSILMTNANLGEQVCIGLNDDSPRLKDFGMNKLDYIANANDCAELLMNQVRKATQAGISLRNDSFLFLVDKRNPEVLDFVIGDLDNVMRSKQEQKKLLQSNIMHAFTALDLFIRRSVVADRRQEYESWAHNLEGAYLVELED